MKASVASRVERDGFTREESFSSKSDAEAWKRMAIETLARPELIAFDLQVYAAGLAENVRRHGGKATRAAWISGEAPAKQWARGQPFPLPSLKDQMLAVLNGKGFP